MALSTPQAFILSAVTALVLASLPLWFLLALNPLGILLRSSSNREQQSGQESIYDNVDVTILNNTRPTSEWMNMGWWTDRRLDSDPKQPCDAHFLGDREQPERIQEEAVAQPCTTHADPPTFPEACQRLANNLYRASGLPRAPHHDTTGLSILDLGHGTGESLLLLLREYRPAILHGVTLDRRGAARALSRLSRAARDQSAQGLSSTAFNIWQCDATTHLRSKAGDRVAEAVTEKVRYDYIFALDCAYHFSGSKADFFEAAYERLGPGGTLSLFDIFEAMPYPKSDSFAAHQSWFSASRTLPRPRRQQLSLWQSVKLRLFSLIAAAPRQNILPFAEYYRLLRSAGFADITLLDVSEDVFPGFSQFLRGLGEEQWRKGSVPWAMKTSIRFFSGFVRDWADGGDRGLLRGGIVVARKQTRHRTDIS